MATPLAGIAQINSTQGWFEINFNQGCAPLQVSVKTAISENDVPIFQFNGANDPNPVAWRDTFDSLSHTYTSPGNYTIYLTVQTNNVIRQDSLSVNVLQSQLPVFELKNCQGNGLLVDIQDNFYDSYIVDYGDGNSVTIPSGAPDPAYSYPDNQTYTVTVTGRLNNAPNNCGSVSTPYTPAVSISAPLITRLNVTNANDIELSFNLSQNIDYRLEASANSASNFQFLQFLVPQDTGLVLTGFSPDTQPFCFRIGAIDACNGSAIYSNVVCSISASLTIVNNVNQLSWKTIEQGSGEENYRISRNAIQDFITFPAATFNFNDQQVFCNTDYCYTVTITYNNGAESIAPQVCGTAFSTDVPPAIESMSIDVRSEGVLLSIANQPDIDSSQIIQTSSSGLRLGSYLTATNATFLPVDLKQYPQSCYEHTYLNVCGNLSKPLGPVCSILLTGVSNPDGSIGLTWTDYTGWKDSVQVYTLEKYSKDGDLLESIPVGLVTSFVDEVNGTRDQIVIYKVRATPNDNTFPDIHSNEIFAARRAQLNYPDAFTPDGDGLNDTFRPQYLFIKAYKLSIYNRWGQMIFSSDDVESGWDGIINGDLAGEGSYTYLAKAEDFRGLKISRSGILLLLRK